MLSFHSLPETNALLPGADLWVLPDLPKSSWTRKIDWYCNFQILKSTRRQTRKISHEMKNILSETGSGFFEIDVSPVAPVMLSTSFFLPNTKTIILPFEENPATWVIKCHYLWQRLKNPSLRVFLPPSLDANFFQNQWPLKQVEGSINLVSNS